MTRRWLLWGSILAALAVAAGAFGAHALSSRLAPDMLSVYETAVRYQMYHALGLLAVAWMTTQDDARLPDIAGYLFVAGVALFSGSLYALVLTGTNWLGAVTPLGGVAFIGGWICVALHAYRLPGKR